MQFDSAPTDDMAATRCALSIGRILLAVLALAAALLALVPTPWSDRRPAVITSAAVLSPPTAAREVRKSPPGRERVPWHFGVIDWPAGSAR